MEKVIRFYTIQEWRKTHKSDLNEPIIMSFKDSAGERWTKTAIDHKIREAKQQFKEDAESEGRSRYCWACGHVKTDLTCSHIISVDKCQKDGRCEEAWNTDNIQIECIDCHRETENRTFDHHANARYKRNFIEHYESNH